MYQKPAWLCVLGTPSGAFRCVSEMVMWTDKTGAKLPQCIPKASHVQQCCKWSFDYF